MSAISELTDRLRLYAIRSELTYPYWSRAMKQAADTIEELSAKLTIVNMERSSAWYGGGWIPVEERLPEEHDSAFAKLYGTDGWRETMWRKWSDKVLVTVELEDGTRVMRHTRTYDGKWVLGEGDLSGRVTAWMPLPAPYKED